MINLSNFNSFWEFYLAVYVFFMFIDLFPGLEKRLPSIIYSYPLGLDDFLTKSEIDDIKRCGWQGILFRYSGIKLFGLISSALCTFGSFTLLLIGCYFPNYKIHNVTSAGLIIILITPFCYVLYSMSFGLKKLKLKYVLNNLKYISKNLTDYERAGKIDCYISKGEFLFISDSDVK